MPPEIFTLLEIGCNSGNRYVTKDMLTCAKAFSRQAMLRPTCDKCTRPRGMKQKLNCGRPPDPVSASTAGTKAPTEPGAIGERLGDESKVP